MPVVNSVDPAVPAADDEEISLLEIFNTVLRNWRVVAIIPLVLAVLVGVWSLTRERSYAASASFMPQVAERGGASSAAGLAQQFGVNLGQEAPGQSPQFYVDLLRSRSLLRQAVETVYQVPTDDGAVWEGTLVEYWNYDERVGVLPPWRHATERLSDRISASVSRETGIVRLAISADNPSLAEQIAARVLELLNQFNLQVRQNRAQEEGRFIGARVTDAQAELLTAEGALLEFLQQNREFRNSPELTFENERLQRQVLMRQEVYTSLLRSREQARIDAVRDVPLFTVIDEPAESAQPQGRGTVVRSLLAFILGIMLAGFVAFVREAARRGREARNPHYREFRSLAREAWTDLRHPRGWLRRGEKP